MNTLFSLLIWSVISAGIIADRWFGLTAAGNVAIFIIWFFTVVSILNLFLVNNKDTNEATKKTAKKTNKHVIRFAYFFGLVLMVSAGWFVTATFSFIGWVCLYLKRTVAEEECKPPAKAT